MDTPTNTNRAAYLTGDALVALYHANRRFAANGTGHWCHPQIAAQLRAEGVAFQRGLNANGLAVVYPTPRGAAILKALPARDIFEFGSKQRSLVRGYTEAGLTGSIGVHPPTKPRVLPADVAKHMALLVSVEQWGRS